MVRKFWFNSPLAMTQLIWEPGTCSRMRNGVTLALESSTVSSAPTRRPADIARRRIAFVDWKWSTGLQRKVSGGCDVHIDIHIKNSLWECNRQSIKSKHHQIDLSLRKNKNNEFKPMFFCLRAKLGMKIYEVVVLDRLNFPHGVQSMSQQKELDEPEFSPGISTKK